MIKVILYFAFGIAVLQYTAHTILFLTSKPKHGQDEIVLINAMKSNHWNFGGFKRSYWNFYFGGGLIAILFGLFEISILLLLLIIPPDSLYIIKPLIAIVIVSNILHGIISIKYFFLLPVLFDIIIAVLLIIAFVHI